MRKQTASTQQSPLRKKALNNQACLNNLGQLLGNKANCTPTQLNSCISQVLNMMTITCQNLTPAGTTPSRPCQIASVNDSYPYATNQDKKCLPSKSAAPCKPCPTNIPSDNCALCAGVNQIPVDLCRTPDPATFKYPKNPPLATSIDKVYCAKGLTDPNVAVLASILIHEASHSCAGGHKVSIAGGISKTAPFDQCGRPDATLVQNAYSACMGWPPSKNPGTPKP